MADFYGTDLLHDQDYQLRAGDLDTLTGLENVKAAILRRIMTEPRSIVHRPSYGVGLRSYQNAPMTLSTQKAIAFALAEQIELDPRVDQVLGVSVVPNGEQITMTVRVRVKGYGETQIQYTPFGGS